MPPSTDQSGHVFFKQGTKSEAIMAHAVVPVRGRRRQAVQGQPGLHGTCLKQNTSKKGWQNGSEGKTGKRCLLGPTRSKGVT